MRNKNLICYVIIFLFTFSYFCFLSSDYYVVADDTIFHTSNILVMAKEINFFHLIPNKIMPILVNNLGYGVNLFYPILPHLIGSYLLKIFSLVDIGIVGVMKFMHFMVICLSGIFMYKYIIDFFKNRKQALLTAILYQSMPYVFTNVFMRGALNESFVFVYLPIIFLGFHYLFEKNEVNKFYFCFVLGYSLLIYSHLVLAVYLTLLLIPFLLVYYRKLFHKEVIRKLIIGSIIILLITSNFWGPLLEHYLLHNYYIFNLKYVDTMDVQIANVLYYLFPIKYFHVRSDYFLCFFISPICMFLFVCDYWLLYQRRIKKEHSRLLGGMLCYLVISILVASCSFLWQFVPNILKNIQFTWRIALFVAFGASVLSGYAIRLFHGRGQNILLMVVIVLSAFFNFYLTSKLSYVNVDEIEFLKDSCCDLQWSYEYLPSVAKYHSLQLYNKGEYLGNKFTKIIDNDVPNMKFEVFGVTDNIVVEFPRIFYLGYVLRSEDGKEVDVYQNGFGLLQADIDLNGVYYLEYEGTIIDKITKVLTFGTIFGCIIYFVGVLFKKRNY